MARLEEKIKDRIGSDLLIGCYTKKDGKGRFIDLRGAEGEVPSELKVHKIEIPYTAKTLNEMEFYTFHWHVVDESTFRFAVDGDVKPIDKKEFLNKLFHVYADKKGKDMEDSVSFQNTILGEVTGAEHTFIYELLQNANDYPYEGERDQVAVQFVLTEHYLLFLHSGAEFNLRNIVGICSINQGEKKGNTETIGYKGIGFKTVFVNNDYVYLHSGDWKLRFDKNYSEEEAKGYCAWSLMPIPTDETELDKELQDALKNVPANYRVQFALRHKSDAQLNIPQLDKVFSDNQILLFIPHVSKAEVYIGKELRYDVKKNKEEWVVTPFKFPVPQDLKEWVNQHINDGNKIPEKFKDINNIGISFAVGRKGRVIEPVKDACVYNYLPTDLRLGFNFLLNADFVPNAARNGLHDVIWNDVVMEECGRKFVDWWSSFFAKEGEWDINSVLSIIPDVRIKDPYAIMFMKGFCERRAEVPCIPVEVKGKYHVCKISEIIIDSLGLVSGDNPIFTDEEFYTFTETDKFLPHKDIRCNENLEDLLSGAQYKVFDGNFLYSLTQNTAFKTWLKVRKNNIRFNSFIIKEDLLSIINNYPIFLGANGELGIMSQLYLDVDKYMDDLAFVQDFIHRLDPEVREALQQIDKWHSAAEKFNKFIDFKFAQELIRHFSEIQDRLSIKKNNIGFFRFFAKIKLNAFNLQDLGYQMFSDKDELVTINNKLFMGNELSSMVMNQSWADESWFSFVSEDYFDRDNENTIRRFMMDLNIRNLTKEILFDEILSKEENILFITKAISDKEINKSFYRFMADNFNNAIKYKYTSKMKNNFILFATNGKNEVTTTISNQVYLDNEVWEEAVKEPWMPDDVCLALSPSYLEGLDEETINYFINYMHGAGLAIPLKKKQLGVMITNNIIPICKYIQNKEDSKVFLNYLFQNRNDFFKDSNINGNYQKIPVLWENNEEMLSISETDQCAYFHTKDLDFLCNQKWFDESSLYVCDHYYDDLFDGSERQSFYNKLGIMSFDMGTYFHRNIMVLLNNSTEILSQRDKNIEFHHFLFTIHSSLTPDDYDRLKNVPIYIESPDDEEGELAEKSNNHYIPSSFLTEVIKLDLVPIDLLDTVHNDYIHTEEERKYYEKYLDNATFTEISFISYIVKNVDYVSDYLKDKERNVRFWRWVCDAKLDAGDKAKLIVFPMLGHQADSDDDEFMHPNELFISRAYSEVDNIEDIIRKFTGNPYFVSLQYKEENDDRDWMRLFKAIQVTTDTKDIVFKHVIPKLEKYQRLEIVSLLAEHEREITKMLNDGNPKLKQYIAKLRLLCVDGVYRYPQEAILSGNYFDFNEDPIPEVVLGYLVSESYIEKKNQSVEKIQKIKRLLVSVANSCGNPCDNLTSLRKEKVNYYLKHQNLFQLEDHLNIIAQLARYFYKDPDGIRESFKDAHLYLYDTNNQPCPSNELYLSSCYDPDCDFMGNDIMTLRYLSGDYAPKIPIEYRGNFFRLLCIRDTFTSNHIELLRNSIFARYFWEDYAQYHQNQLSDICTDDKLRKVFCIPSSKGIKRPIDLYDYRNPRFQSIVLFLKDGKDKLPNVELPKWVGHIGLRGKLTITDCLEYLRLDKVDYRSDVIGWLIETDTEVLSRYNEQIDEYLYSANWLNGKKEWVSLKSLVALEWKNETQKGNFSNNAYVCNPSYMPDYKQDYEKICKIFNIKILTNTDFKKRKSGKFFDDIEAKNEIKKRLLYLAFKSEKKNWSEIYEGYVTKLDACEICSCEKIDYFYNENISTDLLSFTEDNDKLWYVGKWDGKMFLDIVAWVVRVFDIKGLQDSFIDKLFATDFKDWLLNKEHDLPQEFINYLNESERYGLLVNDEDEAARLDEPENESVSLDASVVGVVNPDAPEPEQPKVPRAISSDNNEEQDNTETKGNDDADENSRKAKIVNLNASYHERKERSDREESRTHNNRNDSDQDNSDSYREPNSSQLHQEQTKDLESKLREKWERMANKNIHKPFTRSYNDDEDEEYDVPSNYLGSNNIDSFFDKDNCSLDRYNGHKNGTEQNLKRKNSEARIAAEKTENQLEINNLRNNTLCYTFLWFKYTIELMFTDKSKFNISKLQIDFFGKCLICDNKILRLTDPSQVIPKWIENADNLQVIAYKSGSRTIVKAYVVKVDDTSVDLLLDVKESQISLCQSATMFRLKAENSSNIISALTDRFHQLPYDDNYNLKDNLPQDILFIYGPPGTGKTTRLVEKLDKIITGADKKINILVLTPTNKAADVIAKKLADNENCYSYLSRYGLTNDPSLIENEAIVTTRDTMDMDAYDHNIVVTTIARYPYDTLKPDDEFICDYAWDYIVIDEASMINIVEICYVLHKAQNTKFIIAGDPKQIEPVKQGEIEVENIYQMIGINELSNAINNFKLYPIEALTMQYRSVPTIGDLVSRLTYNGLVQPYPQRSKQKPLKIDGMDINTINFLGFEVREFDQLYDLNAVGKSAIQLYSTIFTYNMVRYTVKQIAKNHPNKDYSIGVICPYGAEANAIKQLLEERPIVENNITVNCGTVHSFQGDECDIMFVVLNPPKNNTAGTHVNNLNIINVAISRARDYLFFVVPEGQIDGFGIKNRLGEIIDVNNRAIFHCSELEKVIFGADNYIEKNTTVTCHMPVNVYYESATEYEIRWDENSLDIQIHDF